MTKSEADKWNHEHRFELGSGGFIYSQREDDYIWVPDFEKPEAVQKVLITEPVTFKKDGYEQVAEEYVVGQVYEFKGGLNFAQTGPMKGKRIVYQLELTGEAIAAGYKMSEAQLIPVWRKNRVHLKMSDVSLSRDEVHEYLDRCHKQPSLLIEDTDFRGKLYWGLVKWCSIMQLDNSEQQKSMVKARLLKTKARHLEYNTQRMREQRLQKHPNGAYVTPSEAQRMETAMQLNMRAEKRMEDARGQVTEIELLKTEFNMLDLYHHPDYILFNQIIAESYATFYIRDLRASLGIPWRHKYNDGYALWDSPYGFIDFPFDNLPSAAISLYREYTYWQRTNWRRTKPSRSYAAQKSRKVRQHRLDTLQKLHDMEPIVRVKFQFFPESIGEDPVEWEKRWKMGLWELPIMLPKN